jgi:hypothetical protein
MKVLVLTTEPFSAKQLREVLTGDVEPAEIQVMVVAPALHEGPIQFWLSEADEPIQRAEHVRRRSVEQLGEGGVTATGDTGEGDPIEAIADALNTFDADRIVVFAHPDSQQRYREEIDVQELERRFGIPVDRATLASSDA